VVAIALGEPGASAIARRIGAFDTLVAANLVEAEVRSALARERVPPGRNPVAGLRWILPDRPLSAEISIVTAEGYVRGADLWHLACALYVAASPDELTFLTLDERQRAVAAALGFKT
jgi:hypothetical protein